MPADLGFYDLRAIEAIEGQAKLAHEYAICGFSFYHYWFSGRRLLDRPVDLILRSGKPDFPFMLFWANETWSKRWLGEDRDVLMRQDYSEEDDWNHVTWLCDHVFADRRYIRIDEKPVFVIYRPGHLPDCARTLRIFRDVAKQKGFAGLYLIGSNAHSNEIRRKQLEYFDIILNFEPKLGTLPGVFNDKWSFKRLRHNTARFGVCSGRLKLYDYAEVKQLMQRRSLPGRFLPCPFVGWDNTARRGEKAIIMVNQDPAVFADSLRWAKEVVRGLPEQQRLVFINAWNEWAEGNHLEPCAKYGRQFLESVKNVVNED